MKAKRRVINTQSSGDETHFKLSDIYPEFPRGSGRRQPLPIQKQILDMMVSGEMDGGIIVLQGGKGSSKTLTGVTTDFFVHHHAKWRGVDSLIARESYGSLCTSTALEYWKILETRVPPKLIKNYQKPSTNSMGFVNWESGGTTFFCSLSNPDTWESINLGFVWVDEAHRQVPQNARDLMSRVRQDTGPRIRLITSNPMGRKVWFHDLAHPKSKKKMRRSFYHEASSLDNPTLPTDYIESLEDLYGKDTVAYKRWVEGKSNVMEGTVFDQFDDNPENKIHIVPWFELPESWQRGRGLDWGVKNPCSVVWAAYGEESWWVYHVHEDNGMSPLQHADFIREGDAMQGAQALTWVAADPEIFRKNKTKESGEPYGTCDEFYEAGIDLTPGNNNRKFGLAVLAKLIAVDRTKKHPVTLKPGSPSIFILDCEGTRPLVECLASLQWPDHDRMGKRDTMDDVQKKDDHAYDALRYLVCENPVDLGDLTPITRREKDGYEGRFTVRGWDSKKRFGGYRGYEKAGRSRPGSKARRRYANSAYRI